MFPKQMSGTSIGAWCAVAQLGEHISHDKHGFDSCPRTSEELLSSENVSPINSCVDGIHLVSSTRHAIGCMLRHHSFSLRQPPVTLPMGGV